ncbi:MAG: proprotein convertase P-domain-containing protein [Planctomycetota bacterium]
MLLLACGLATSAVSAGTTYHYSFLLRDTPFATNPEITGAVDPNAMFSYDPATRLAVVTSTRLADAIDAQFPGETVTVDALTYGHGAICLQIPHGDIFFSISRNPANGSHGGLYGSDLFHEHLDDCEADLFWTENVPATSPTFMPNVKAADDNDAPLPRKKRFTALPYPTLGLTGSIGNPKGTPPAVSNVCAFDHHPPNYSNGDIYFSIAESVGGFHPADILLLPAGSTVIQCFRPFTRLGLGALDDIDALSIDIHHSASVNQCPVGLYSLTRNSPSTQSGADLTLFYLDYDPALGPAQCNNPPQIYRWGIVTGVNPGDGDIDSVVSIDPRTVWRNKANPAGTVVILETSTTGLSDSWDGAIDGVGLGAQLGPTTAVPLPGPFGSGDAPVISTWGRKGETTRLGGICQPTFAGDFDAIDPASIVVTETATGAELEWTNPPGTVENEIQLDNAAPTLVPATIDASFVAVAPGVHAVTLRAIDVSGGRSDPVVARFEVASTAPTPSDAALTITGDQTLTLTWNHDAATVSIEVTLDGIAQAPIAVTPGSTSGSTSFTVGYGYHQVSLRAVTATGVSAPAALDHFVPRPPPGTVLASTSYTGTSPRGIAYVPDLEAILVNDRVDNMATYFDATTLDTLNTIANPGGEVQGVTVVDPLDTPTELLWVVNEPTPTLYQSDNDGSALVMLAEIPAVTTAGELSRIPDLNGAFAIVDESDLRVHVIDDSGDASFGVAPIEHPAPDGLLGAVAGRPGPGGSIDLPLAYGLPGVTTHIGSIALTGAARDSAELDTISGTVVGITYVPDGPRGIPVWFVITDVGTLYEVAAPGDLPDDPDCHLPIFGGVRARNGTPASIPDDDPTGVERTIVLSSPGTVADLDVVVGLTHEQMSDLTVEIISPLGTAVTLQSGVLPYEESMRARYDDVLPSAFNDGQGDRTTSGPGLLANFDGEPIAGTWTLRITDDRSGETGTLDDWQILICPESENEFIRGDINQDGSLNISDGIFLLSHLFAGGPAPPCNSAADTNDDGIVNIGDVIAVLNFLFIPAAPAPPEPRM